jgi:sporulation protein YlmC with PRC-barrel domain
MKKLFLALSFLTILSSTIYAEDLKIDTKTYDILSHAFGKNIYDLQGNIIGLIADTTNIDDVDSRILILLKPTNVDTKNIIQEGNFVSRKTIDFEIEDGRITLTK